MTLHRQADDADSALSVNPLFARPGETGEVPKYALPHEPMAPETAYQLVHDELMLDGNARMNLATFVTTWMEPAAEKLMAECFDKNIVDKDEYPQSAEIERRCVNMLARLWHAPDAGDPVGCSTTGSSEAAMLGGMALVRRWRARARAEGRPADRPNLVMGINVQVCWEKFCRYWDVEPRYVPMEGERFMLDGPSAVERCDENTVGVVAILGSTFDGRYEPVAGIARALDDLQERTGLDVPIHVDGASGAMIAPFLEPDLEWDFREPRVASVNTSGHKYGHVYPGVGWALWRDRAALPEDLVFHVNYLGGDMPTFSLNFSRPGAQVVGQYYNFLRLGFAGYERVQRTCRDVATRLAHEVAALGAFELVSDGSELPVFAARMSDDVTSFSIWDVSRRLHERGWQVPAYTFPKNREDLAVLRFVVRNGFGHDLADMLVADLRRVLDEASRQPAPMADASSTAFHH